MSHILLKGYPDGNPFVNLTATTLTSQTIDTQSISFDTDENLVHAHQEGKLHWDADDGTLAIDLELGGIHHPIGQETLIRVSNKSGADIGEMTAVIIEGAQGNRPTIMPADNTDSDKLHLAGITAMDIANNANGYIVELGLIHDVDTSGTDVGEVWADGDKLYLSGAGLMSNSHPTVTNNGIIVVATVIRSHATVGQLLVTPPEVFTIGNNFSGTLRQSVINKNGGEFAAASFTVVNHAGHRGSMNILTTGNTLLGSEVFLVYQQGYGETHNIIDGAKDFVWFNDPTDSHDFSFLNYEVMRLTSSGTLNMGTSNYETLVLANNDVPNKKYVDDEISGHTHEYSGLSQTGHTHIAANITDLEDWLTGNTHDILSADTYESTGYMYAEGGVFRNDGVYVNSAGDYGTGSFLFGAGGSAQITHITSSDTFRLNKSTLIQGTLSASTLSATTISGNSVYGVDFSDVANTAHTHEYSGLSQTGHSHTESEISDLGDYLTEELLTGTTHDVFTADTVVINTGITYPNGKLITMTSMARDWWVDSTATLSQRMTQGHSSELWTGKYFYLCSSAPTYLVCEIEIPQNYVAGTPITFDYAWQMDNAPTEDGHYTQIDYTVKSNKIAWVDDGDNYTWSSYGRDDNSRAYSAMPSTVKITNSLNRQGVRDLPLVDSDGEINGYAVRAGDCLSIRLSHDHTDPDLGGVGLGSTSDIIMAIFARFNIYVGDESNG